MGGVSEYIQKKWQDRSLFKMVNWLLNIFLKFTEVSEIEKNKINSDP